MDNQSKIKTTLCALALVLTASAAHAEDAILKCVWAPAQGENLAYRGGTDFYRISSGSWKFWYEATRTWENFDCTTNVYPFVANGKGMFDSNDIYSLTCRIDVTDNAYVFNVTGTAKSIFYDNVGVVSEHSGRRTLTINRMDGTATDNVGQYELWPPTGKETKSNINATGQCEKTVDPATIPPPPAPKPIM